jgi:hypothetical protein
MNNRSLRKRLDRLERILKPETEAAALATAPAAEPVQEQEDSDESEEQIRSLSDLLARAKAATELPSEEEIIKRNREFDAICRIELELQRKNGRKRRTA